MKYGKLKKSLCKAVTFEWSDLMKIGYACLTVGVPNTQFKTVRKANASSERLIELIEHNLNSLEQMIAYNQQNGIKMLRISSDIIPFGSDYQTNTLKWADLFQVKLNQIGEKIKQQDMRVSMHPGQYTVLNSPKEEVVKRSIADLEYHTLFLDSLNVDASHKIILHIGGVYDERPAAIDRFIQVYSGLSQAIKNRLIIENDDRLYTIEEVLSISQATGAPVVYDNLHNACNPSDESISDHDWIEAAKKTWQDKDGPAKIHYSQQRPNARLGAHTDTIYIEPFIKFYNEIRSLEVDIMLEVKDKNLSAVKANLAVQEPGHIKYLEKEWARYKYNVLGHSQHSYQKIRELLKDKDGYPVIEFYRLIEEALEMEASVSSQLNAFDHVWGHLKKSATEKEAERYKERRQAWMEEKISLKQFKSWLKRLAQKYEESYLLASLFFDID